MFNIELKYRIESLERRLEDSNERISKLAVSNTALMAELYMNKNVEGVYRKERGTWKVLGVKSFPTAQLMIEENVWVDAIDFKLLCG